MADRNKSAKKPGKGTTARSPNPAVLKEAMVRRLVRRTVVSGTITIPAVPALLDFYIGMCARTFQSLGRAFTPTELAHAKEVLTAKVSEAFAGSPRSNVVIKFNAPVGTVLNYEVIADVSTLAVAYENWLGTRTPPLFGTHPDARVMALAEELADPAASPVLDIGAGTGRNALALARRGHPVDAVELTPKFAEMMQADAEKENLTLRIIQRNMFEAADDLRRDYRLIFLSEVLSDFRGTDELKQLFELAASVLAPSGTLVFNVHVASRGYTPDKAARELAQQCYSMLYTYHELDSAAAGLPLERVGDDSVYEYEKEHLPEGAWPPTGWYAEWVAGQDVYDLARELCPAEMRWLVYKKAGEAS
jgi:2-polyprenyl-3-methyl-5-hydroxy-6-metoxy-1,4-benzoquinol methylase